MGYHRKAAFIAAPRASNKDALLLCMDELNRIIMRLERRKMNSAYGEPKYIELERLANEARAFHGRVNEVYETEF